jgi:RNA polymerase-binding protein DksA
MEDRAVALTQDQIGALKGILDKRYDTLLEEVRDELERSENQQYVELLGRTPGDSADESVADALADLSLGVIDRHIRELRDIEATRARVREGRFGRCTDCGDDIGFERLRVYPTAKRCVRCQGQHERTHAHEGTPTL